MCSFTLVIFIVEAVGSSTALMTCLLQTSPESGRTTAGACKMIRALGRVRATHNTVGPPAGDDAPSVLTVDNGSTQARVRSCIRMNRANERLPHSVQWLVC